MNMEIDRKFKCSKCDSDNVSFHLWVHQDFSIKFPSHGFCHSCNHTNNIVETELSKLEFDNTKIINQ